MELIRAIATLEEITFESIKSIHKFPAYTTKIKLIGASARNLAVKIKDERITTSGQK